MSYSIHGSGCDVAYRQERSKCVVPRFDLSSTTAIVPGNYKVVYVGKEYGLHDTFLSRLTLTFNIVITGITIGPENLPNGKVGVTYESSVLTATGGTEPYTFTAANLPDGLSVQNGKISGIPTKAGGFNVAITATDDKGYSETRKIPIFIEEAPTIIISPDELVDGKVGVDYPGPALSAKGGIAPYKFTVDVLPDGLSLDATSGKITGIPTKAGSPTVTVTATDSKGNKGTKAYTFVVAEPTIIISPDELVDGKVGVDYPGPALSAKGGIAPYKFTVDVLPDGLSLDATSGKITGIPTKAGSPTVTVTATDSKGNKGTKAYTFVVAEPTIKISPDALPAGTAGIEYTPTQLTAAGGIAPYTFGAEGLPGGLSLTDGKITGIPVKSGGFDVTISAKDSSGYSGAKSYVLNIVVVLPKAQSQTMNVIAGTSSSVELTQGASGGPFTGAKIVTATTAAEGNAWITAEADRYLLNFHASPTFSGATQLTYSLSNAYGSSAPATVSIRVIARPDPSKDPEVIGLVRAQVDAANQLATAQISNFNQRLEQLHNDGECRTNSVQVSVGLQGQQLQPNLDMLDKLWQSKLDAEACSKLKQKLSLWTNGQISSGKYNDDDDKTQNHNAIGISGGIDYRFSPAFIGGVGFGYGHVVTDVGEHGTHNKGNMVSTAAYGSFHPSQNIFLDGVVGYGWLQFDSNRYVTPNGGNATGERQGSQLFGSLTLGYQQNLDNWLLSPYARIDAARTKLNRFDETGADIYNLTFGKQTTHLLSTTLGIRTEYTVPMEWGALKPRGRLEYAHDFSGSSQANVGYTDMGGILPYVVDVDPQGRDSFKIEVGIDAHIQNSWQLGLDYSTVIGAQNRLQHNYRWKVSKAFN